MATALGVTALKKKKNGHSRSAKTKTRESRAHSAIKPLLLAKRRVRNLYYRSVKRVKKQTPSRFFIQTASIPILPVVVRDNLFGFILY